MNSIKFITIDVQSWDCGSLKFGRDKTFPEKINWLSNEFASLGAESIPVALRIFIGKKGFHQNPSKELLDALKFLPPYYPEGSRYLYVKEVENAFGSSQSPSELSLLLKNEGVWKIYLAGMNTHHCFFESVRGAAITLNADPAARTEICVVYDCVAESNRFYKLGKSECDPETHKNALLKLLDKAGLSSSPNISFITAETALDQVRSLNATPKTDSVLKMPTAYRSEQSAFYSRTDSRKASRNLHA